MNLTAITAAAIAMLAWGSAAICDKYGMRGISNPLLAITIRLSVAFVAFWIFILIRGDWREVRTVPAANWAPLALGALLAAIVGQLCYFIALKHADASRVVPFTASYPVVALVLAAAILREPLTVPKVIGTLMILGGLTLVSGLFGRSS